MLSEIENESTVTIQLFEISGKLTTTRFPTLTAQLRTWSIRLTSQAGLQKSDKVHQE